ncbi:hypothetical protein cypCar_00012514, partial [Cyprinus carpio]
LLRYALRDSSDIAVKIRDGQRHSCFEMSEFNLKNVPGPPAFQWGSPGRSLTVFTNPDVYNTTTLLLSNDEGTLFVGARDAILTINVSQSDAMTMEKKNSKTFAMAIGPSGKPEEGRGRCPYDPYQKNTAITVDGELYTGTVADYRGTRPVISRHLSEGSHVDLKLDDTLGWLEDPTFISSTYVPSEEKVYIFFSEIGKEYDFIDKFIVSRVAQVCTSDVGGQRTLQKRWTTFAKAQLLCQADQELPYNILQDIVSLSPPEGTSEDETLFYGIFTSQWQVNLGRSAVCAFSLKDIKKVFTGHYKVLNRDTLKWSTRVQEQMANPGECGLHNASDNTLRFVKDNFLADKSVRPVNQGLELVSPDKSYSNIAAQRVRGAHGRDYTVLYLLTAVGYLPQSFCSEESRAHIMRTSNKCFNNPQQGAVLIGSSEGVISVPMSNCSYYWSCAECVLARDPFCGWDPVMKLCTDMHTHDHLVQDVDEGNVSAQCTYVSSMSRSGQSRTPSTVCPPGEVLSVSLNEVVHLQCPEASHLAKRHWERLNSQLSPKIYIQSDDGSLSFVATPSTLGHYLCQTVENGYTQTLLVYHVKQKSNPTILPATPNHPPSTPSTKAGNKTPVHTPRLIAPRQTEPRPEPDDVDPTVTLKDSPVATTHKSRNFTRLLGMDKENSRMTEPGENLQQADKLSYFQELVVVSVLLALCVSALLMIAVKSLRHLYHGRTVLEAPSSRRDAENGGSATPQERESLRGHSPRLEKRNGQAPNGQAHNGKSPITLSNSMLNSSNGHLPNTPM